MYRKRFNYKITKWEASDILNAVEVAKTLPIDAEVEEDNYYTNDFIMPIDSEAGDENQPYSGFLTIWKNDDNTYSVVFFLSYYCGDEFCTDEQIVPFGDNEKLKTTIESMVEKYSDRDVLDKLIEDQINKESESVE